MLLVVGHIGKPHGVRGEVLVTVRTDEPEARFVAGAVYTTQVPRDRRVSTVSARGPRVTAGISARPAPAGDAAGGGGADGTGPNGTGFERAGSDGLPGTRYDVPETLTLESLRWHQGRVIAVFEGVDDRNVAEMLRGVLLCVDSAHLQAPEDPDEFHDHQLVGLGVESVDGEALGEIERIDHAPASDLIVLRRTAGGSSLIPFVRQIVIEVDLPGGRVVVDPPGGLFDL